MASGMDGDATATAVTGLLTGAVDGVFGPMTIAALQA